MYRTIQRTRSVSVKVIFCCSGWRKRYSSSRECAEGNLECLVHYFVPLMPSPPYEKMSAKLYNDNTLSCYCLYNEAGHTTFNMQKETKTLTVLVGVVDKTQKSLRCVRLIYPLLYLPTQIHIPIGGERVTCHGPTP